MEGLAVGSGSVPCPKYMPSFVSYLLGELESLVRVFAKLEHGYQGERVRECPPWPPSHPTPARGHIVPAPDNDISRAAGRTDSSARFGRFRRPDLIPPTPSSVSEDDSVPTPPPPQNRAPTASGNDLAPAAAPEQQPEVSLDYDDADVSDTASLYLPPAGGGGPHDQEDKMGCCSKKQLLMITTSLCASGSLAFLIIAVATDYWLYTAERRETENDVLVITNIGLWRRCNQTGKIDFYTG